MAEILIIDDDPIFCVALGAHVEKQGHAVSSCHSLREGIRAAEEGRAEAVFLDVDLPDGNGLEEIQRIKRVKSEPEVVIVTGRGEQEGARLAIQSGALTYIQKGASFEEALHHLTLALEFRTERLAAKATRALDLDGILGNSPALRSCFDLLAQAAGSEAPVLLTGESGTGKEVFARGLHRNSGRRDAPFVVVDCAALPASLVESMLFGHTRGAFTGANEDRKGLVELAHGGTLFLDEVGEMPLGIQKSFLRLLQERRFRPVGAGKEVHSDFRVIAATNQDLERCAGEGTFREDLLFRLRSFVIHLPPLRDRGADVKTLAKAHVATLCERQGRAVKGISPAYLDELMRYTWPGNVRELLLAVERSVAAAAEFHTLFPMHLPPDVRIEAAASRMERRSQKRMLTAWPASPEKPLPTLQAVRDAVVAEYLGLLLSRTGHNVEQAAGIAGVSRTTFYDLMKKHGVGRKD